MLGRAVVLLTLTWSLGCDHVIVQHGSELTLEDAATKASNASRDANVQADAGTSANACIDAEGGTPCDDRDVCSPSSMCQDGVCVGGSAFDACVVADTLEEFGETQGADGWHYGYWNERTDDDGSYQPDTDFTPMEFCAGERIWMPPGRCDTMQGDDGYRWTRILDWALSHPETRPDTEMPVRRWISDVSGRAHISLHHWLSGSTGDGTRALLVVDGVERWRNDGQPNDDEGTRDAIDIELEEGTIIDQIVHPIGTSGDDMTTFSMRIERP